MRRTGRTAARTRGTLPQVLAVLGLLTLPVAATAQPARAPTAEAARLDAECARLRAELERTNAEVATLKRGGRNVRDDYRLRQKMADAEALARRLTAAETQLRRERGLPPP